MLFTLLSLSIFVSATRKGFSGERPGPSSDRFHWQNIVLVVVGMLAYSLLLKKIGFALCTFGLVVFLFRLIARKNWFNSIVTGVVIAIVFQVFFNILLNAQLPRGILGYLIG